MAIAMLMLVAALASFNWFINPYQLFSSPEVSGLNAFKTRFFFYQLINKPYQLRKQQPDTIILGSSRAGASLEAAHPAYKGTAFNSALAGSGAGVQWYSFMHAVNATAVKRMVLPLDLFMFNACIEQLQEPPYRNYIERIANPTVSWEYPTRWLIDHASALVGLNTTYESWLTLKSQKNFSQSKAGLMHLKAEGDWLNIPADNTSQRSLFHYIENQNLRSGWHPVACYPTKFTGLDTATPSTPLDYIEGIIRQAHKHGVELHIFWSPFHARLAEAMDANGLWETFEDLKRELVRINERAARLHVEPQAPFPLWDFSGYNHINTEPVPTRGDKTSRMQWHRDATHVTPATGDLVQNRLFDLAVAAEHAEFGVRLDSSTIELALDNDRRLRQAYRKGQPGDVAEVRSQAKRAQAWREKHPRTDIPSWLR